MPSYVLQLDDNEIKMLLVAIRQVQHTFTVAESQSTAAGEPLAANYQNLREAYGRLLHKLETLIGAPSQHRPHLVK